MVSVAPLLSVWHTIVGTTNLTGPVSALILSWSRIMVRAARCVWIYGERVPWDKLVHRWFVGSLCLHLRPCNFGSGAYFIGRSRLKKLSVCPLLAECYTMPSGGFPDRIPRRWCARPPLTFKWGAFDIDLLYVRNRILTDWCNSSGWACWRNALKDTEGSLYINPSFISAPALVAADFKWCKPHKSFKTSSSLKHFLF